MKRIGIEIKWALLFVIIQLLWMWMEELAGLHGENIGNHTAFTTLFAIPAVAVYVVALLDKRKNHYNGYMNYWQGLISGLIITLMVTILSPLTQYIFSSVISPDYFSNAIEHAVRNGELSREAAETYFSLKIFIIQGLITTLVLGVIASVIVSLFVWKRKPEVTEAA